MSLCPNALQNLLVTDVSCVPLNSCTLLSPGILSIDSCLGVYSWHVQIHQLYDAVASCKWCHALACIQLGVSVAMAIASPARGALSCPAICIALHWHAASAARGCI